MMFGIYTGEQNERLSMGKQSPVTQIKEGANCWLMGTKTLLAPPLAMALFPFPVLGRVPWGLTQVESRLNHPLQLGLKMSNYRCTLRVLKSPLCNSIGFSSLHPL